MLGQQHAEWLIALCRAPVVVACRRLTGLDTESPLATVRTNDSKGIREAVDYLVELGHRRIHHVGGGKDPGSADRLRAYKAAMRAHGLTAMPFSYVHGPVVNWPLMVRSMAIL